MVTRCTNPKHNSYPRYGGKGISICERWLESGGAGFKNFLTDMGLRPEGMTLDRKDPTGNYSKENCRWATPTTQTYNRELVKTDDNTSVYRGVTFYGKRKKPWCGRAYMSGKAYWLGCFDTEVEAAIAYDRKALELYGQDAILNMPKENYIEAQNDQTIY